MRYCIRMCNTWVLCSPLVDVCLWMSHSGPLIHFYVLRPLCGGAFSPCFNAMSVSAPQPRSFWHLLCIPRPSPYLSLFSVHHWLVLGTKRFSPCLFRFLSCFYLSLPPFLSLSLLFHVHLLSFLYHCSPLLLLITHLNSTSTRLSFLSPTEKPVIKYLSLSRSSILMVSLWTS